jgi:diadenosine tetraphosphate (Ap4A) HIT family hydrolase
MASKFGGPTAAALLGTTVVSAIIFAAYVSVVLARWRVVYDRDPVRYRHVIVAVHRGESVALTPDLPYETADRIVTVLDKVKRSIPKVQDRQRRQAAA